jgi:hypothetical protein
VIHLHKILLIEFILLFNQSSNIHKVRKRFLIVFLNHSLRKSYFDFLHVTQFSKLKNTIQFIIQHEIDKISHFSSEIIHFPILRAKPQGRKKISLLTIHWEIRMLFWEWKNFGCLNQSSSTILSQFIPKEDG